MKFCVDSSAQASAGALHPMIRAHCCIVIHDDLSAAGNKLSAHPGMPASHSSSYQHGHTSDQLLVALIWLHGKIPHRLGVYSSRGGCMETSVCSEVGTQYAEPADVRIDAYLRWVCGVEKDVELVSDLGKPRASVSGDRSQRNSSRRPANLTPLNV
jgi:hypothetical protein